MTIVKNTLTQTLLSMIAMLAILSLSSGISHARPSISEQEKAILQRIMHEIHASNELLQEAQRNTDRQDLFRFTYRCLITDINIIKKGILTAIHVTENRAFQNQELCLKYGNAGQYGNESQFLEQYIQELQSLLPLVQESLLQANRTYRARFNYQVLSSDIQTIIAGIERALIGSGEQIRTFPVLRGKFSQ